MKLVLVAALITTALAREAVAQQASATTHVLPGDYVVRTVPLKQLTSAEAVKLLSPYVRSTTGGVYEVSPSIRAVTIREVPRVYAEMMTVLGQYDRERATITLNFQLIAAENSDTRDPNVAGLDSLLRNVLRFRGYRLLSTAVANASEGGTVGQTLSADGEPLSLSVDVSDVRVDGGAASVQLAVDLRSRLKPLGAGRGVGSTHTMSTRVTVPVGQTVVLGSTFAEDGQKALILTVRPQMASTKR
jgi:hypothetical protein